MELTLELGRARHLTGEAVDVVAAVTNTGAAPVDLPPLLHRGARQPELTLTGPGRFQAGVTTSLGAALARTDPAPAPAPAARPLPPGARDDVLLPLSRLFELEGAEPGRYVLEVRLRHGALDLRATAALELELAAPRRLALCAGVDDDGRAAVAEALFLHADGALYQAARLDEHLPHGAAPAPVAWRWTGLEADADDAEPFGAWRERPLTQSLARWVGWRAGREVTAVPFLVDPRPVTLALAGDGPWRLVDAALQRADEGLDLLLLEGGNLTLVDVPPQELGEPPRPAARRWSLPLPPGEAAAQARHGAPGQPAHVAVATSDAAGLRLVWARVEDGARWSEAATAPGLALLPGTTPAVRVDPDGHVRVAALVRALAPDAPRRCVTCLEARFLPDGRLDDPPAQVGHVHLDPGAAPPVGGLVRYPLAPGGPSGPRWFVALDPVTLLDPDGARLTLPHPAALPLTGEVEGHGLRLALLPPGAPPILFEP
ncbi:MAG: hypothetical protein M9894_26085 [Planctomycetes bacterium]|nr:hypothetical protein [Planctomycetota bacterium]